MASQFPITASIKIPSNKSIDISESTLGLKVSETVSVLPIDFTQLMELKNAITLDEGTIVIDDNIEVNSLILKAIDNTTSQLSKFTLDTLLSFTTFLYYNQIGNAWSIGFPSLTATIMRSDVLCDKTLTVATSIGAPYMVNTDYSDGEFSTLTYSGTGSYVARLKYILKGSLVYFIIYLQNFEGELSVNYPSTILGDQVVNWNANIQGADFNPPISNPNRFRLVVSGGRTGLIEVKAWPS